MTDSNSLYKNYKLDILPQVARNYADWSLDEESYAEHLKLRLSDGISRVDVWNFLEYIAVVAANGITRLGVEASGFRDFQNKGADIGHPEFTDKTMDDVLSSIVTNFNAHARDDDGFYNLIGKDALDESLRGFLLLFPYLYDNRMVEDCVGKPPAVNLEGLNNDKKYRHQRQRETFGVSELDAVRFDLYFAGVLAKGFKILSEIAHGYPADLTEVYWRTLLLSISENFFAYYRGETNVIDSATIDIFVERFSSFWD
jgi:hypothetical protein